MNAAMVIEMLARVQEACGVQSASLRCDCDNLETVYVLPDPERGLVATDRGETFGYLSRGTDETYVPVESLNLSEVRKLCLEHGVTLRERSDQLPACIERIVASNDSLASVIGSVAGAIDAVFELALSPRAGPLG